MSAGQRWGMVPVEGFWLDKKTGCLYAWRNVQEDGVWHRHEWACSINKHWVDGDITSNEEAQACGNCKWWAKSTNAKDMGSAWPNIPGACNFPLPFTIQPSDTFSNEGEDCKAWTPN